MKNKEERSTILAEISNWLKLLGLVVLVAEGVIILAMNLTPAEHPISTWYPVFMLLFLIIIVVGIFMDRFHKRNVESSNLKLELGSRELSIQTGKKLEKQRQDVNQADFIDNKLGFALTRPQMKYWKPPEYLNHKDYLIKTGLIQEEHWQNIVAAAQVMPFGKMLTESETVLFQYGESIKINFTENSTTELIDKHLERLSNFYVSHGEKPLSEEEAKKLREDLFYGQLDLSKMVFSNSFVVQVLDKNLALKSPIEPNLPNLFAAIQRTIFEPLDQLISNKASILWGSTNKIKHIKIEEEEQDITIYRMNRMLENEGNFYQLQIQWSPESKAAISIWEELKKMFETFKLIH
ncbi:hypothetical protein QWY93_14350 [Echinicola jeungdonensis]|uniref:Uncharacterized protein n=1 Tax=Echinicola jeungdonensis TaxID=709343 RepID=A0ABV5JA92_9BACT|nr:hypothetical protein [Echinicola jeungdonensis]MDN3670500.1 hypothetical protein [Echinicola jeungdonensis]